MGKNYDLLVDIIHPDYRPYQSTHDPKATELDLMDPELTKINRIMGIKTRVKTLTNQFRVEKVDLLELVEGGRSVVVHFRMAMKHIGTWNGILATEAEITTYGFHLFNFQD
ncbi:MAG: hypothetical protein IH840_03850 [Candidatus Heimdallarchaeota archaeon]|nr:hypothetical protein [Candidatus Heimdallarchaeota archaeon]